MNDRDFKLLVREYRQNRKKAMASNDMRFLTALYEQEEMIGERLDKELELFTQKDVEELPFKEKI